MSALVSIDRAELARLGILEGTEALLPSRSVLHLDWPELENALPDRGLPRGVIEIAAMPRNAASSHGSRSRKPYPDSMRGGATSIAIAAMSAVHALTTSEARRKAQRGEAAVRMQQNEKEHAADDQAWCAWITAEANGETRMPSLYAPALAKANVDLDRLLVIRPSVQALARTVVKVASSGAFGLLVIDAPDHHVWGRGARNGAGGGGNIDGGSIVVRKLALAAEESGTTSLILTNALAQRATPWPVALRIEVERRPDSLSLRVTKDRRGCASSQHVVRLVG